MEIAKGKKDGEEKTGVCVLCVTVIERKRA